MRFILFCMGLALSLISYGQEFSVNGTIKDSQGHPIPFANALVIKAQDSSFVKGGITNDSGIFEIKNVPQGNYRVLATLIGYQPKYSTNFTLTKDHSIGDITLVSGEQLDEVLVEASKPLYQQKVDRMVINVESSIISTGGNALQILERSPGMMVNRQSNAISVVGKSGVVIMINGKESYVPVSSLISMLEGMSSDNIESIEIITTPPANFDAEGNAGFINIVLKERTDLGLNGSYSISGGYSNAWVTSDNINLNYRNKALSVFGNYSYSYDGTDQIFSFERSLDVNNNFLESYTYSDRDATQRNHNARVGLDYQISDKTITGLLFTAYDNKWTMDAINNTEMSENNSVIDIIKLFNTELNQWKHFGANYNIKHDFTNKNNLTFNFDYLHYNDDNPNDYSYEYYNNSGAIDSTSYARSTKLTPINTFASKLDYSDSSSDELVFNMGVKGTFTHFQNDVAVENRLNNIWTIDPTLSNNSELNESILAVYAQAEWQIDDSWSAKAGLRYEHTKSQLDTETSGRVVDRKYGKFFPSIYLNKKFNDTLSMNLSYSKRITRPKFNDLAPFVILFDPNTFISGNAALQPAFSNAFKLDINYKSYFLSLQYTNEDSTIAPFQERYDEENERLIFEASNLDYTRTYGIVLGLPIKITSWWRTQNNFNYVRQKVRAIYNNDEPIELTLGNFSCNTSQSFKISNSFSAELSGFYMSKGFFGTATYDAIYRVNVGFQKQLGEKWGTLNFAVNDVFDSMEFRGGSDIPEQNLKTNNHWDFFKRTFTLTYTRNFGNKKLQGSRIRETGSEEERQRVQL